MVYRIYTEKKPEFGNTGKLKEELKSLLGISPAGIRKYIRYDVEGLTREEMDKAVVSVFSEPCVDDVTEKPDFSGDVLVVEYLDGQYDQRADSAAQCVQFLTGGVRPEVRCATVYDITGVTKEEFDRIKKYLINPVDSKEGSLVLPQTLKRAAAKKQKMRVELDFTGLNEAELKKFYDGFGFAMTFADLRFVQDYFKAENRQPTLTEIKVIDIYWSDHCRHTTFLTELKSIEINSPNYHIKDALDAYQGLFKELYSARKDKYACLMDVATIAVKKLKKEGYLDNLDVSDEINACSVRVTLDVDGKDEDWLIMFKNETHNHPTEIEPFGGAATCLGGAIRDPLSGRTYVYQAMRVTGAADITEDFDKTIKGKLPQRVISRTALAGFSSYGNQIGLATGGVHELFSEGYKAKRLETGYVIGGAPAANIRREKPEKGDVIILVGGDTGRDGCGGATGSSKSHTAKSVETCGAEVQKGNPPEERKLQRLFRNREAARLIIKCNDFGAGGVCVAIGELSDGLDIFLDRVEKKYDGLTATELAISESQERMAVMVKPLDADRFIELAKEENLKAVKVAVVTDNARLRMFYGDETIVDIRREFLDTNGVKQTAAAVINDNGEDCFPAADEFIKDYIGKGDYAGALTAELNRLDVCSQKGMGETFDGSIGASSVFMPFGGKFQLTPSTVMAAKPPVDGFTHCVTASSYACYPRLMIKSPFTGAIHSVLAAVSKLISAGVDRKTVRLSLQEFFKRLNDVPERWGQPLSALLGALCAQLGLKTGAIGGKDSMSGTFENIDVPPTVIAFAMGVTNDETIINNVFDVKGNLYLFGHKRDGFGYPDFDYSLDMFDEITKLAKDKKIARSCVTEEGGYAVAAAKSVLGCGNGLVLFKSDDLFRPLYGDIVALCPEEINSPYARLIGKVDASGAVTIADKTVSVLNLVKAFTSKLEGVYPTVAPAAGRAVASDYSIDTVYKSKTKSAKPVVFIPVFPGTNCEYDMARAFTREGAEADIFVMRNLNRADIEESIAEMKRRIDNAQIIAFPGGFSGGDEPDGSGKFIVNTFKNEALKEAVENLLYKRDGLVLGICNGFQALIKLGLLPFGHIEDSNEHSPTLTFNNIGRHVSTVVRVRVGTNKSPWLTDFKPGDIFSVPVSHGEGKFVCEPQIFDKLYKNGQIATQYVDDEGRVTMDSPFNPNGSVMAVEGIISPDGKILGKMGHTERYQAGIYQNVPGNFDMNVFRAGVKYFK